jgi:alanine racemase
VVLVKSLPAGTAIGYNRTKVITRDSRIAVVAVGYGDGVPTAASNRGQFLIRGKRCPILGRVSMDQTVVDVTDLPEVVAGDQATILGAQGNDCITVTEFCHWADCIPWEALCTLTQRVQRVYLSDRT